MSALAQRLGQLVTQHLAILTVTLLVVSETLIVQWARLASGRPAYGAAGLAGLALALAALNLLLVYGLRRRRRAFFFSRGASRAFMLGSLGALFSGPPLVLVFVAIGTPLALLRAFGGPTGVAESALVAGGGAAVALGFGSIVWGFVVGQRRVSVERIDIPVRDLPGALDGIVIAQITDLHIGPQLRAPRLRRLVDRVNALDPDLIAITGDIFDFDPAFIEEGCRELAALRARRGVFAILGNHDVYTGADRVAEGIERLTKIRLLRDAWERVEIDGAGLYVLGIDDPGGLWGSRTLESEALERLAHEVPADAPRVLLVHRPSYFPQIARLRIPLAMAGHTHGGQVTLPAPAHQHNISRLITDWTRGLFEDGESILYVSRGLGVAGPPIRLNCPREISLLRLTPRR